MQDWTADEVQRVIAAAGAVLTTVLTIVITITQFLLKAKVNRVEEKTDAQTETLQKQNEVLESHGTVLGLQTKQMNKIETEVKGVADKQ